MASSKKTIAEKMYYGVNPFFFRKTDVQKDSAGNLNILDRFESINRFYSSLEGDDTGYKMNIRDCYALKLASAIIERISSGDDSTGRDGSFGEKFYEELSLSLNSNEVQADNELTVIYLKQMMNIMKSCGLVRIEKRKASVNADLSSKEKIYFQLLKSFWNETDWRHIFPSSPEAAGKLHSKREVFLDFLEDFYTKVSIEDLANDFFEMTDIAPGSDFFMISFLDFYLLTWLRHFGIIEYSAAVNSEVVHVMLNDYGRDIVKILR